MSNLKILPQEENGLYQFSSQLFMTRNFLSKFKDNAPLIAFAALQKAKNRAVQDGADYLQVFEINGIRFWLIDDVDHVTALLPEDY